jgi:dolichol-phosphate mannosyltransferase
MTVAVSVVIPAYNEGENIVPVLERIFAAVQSDCEVLIVVDSDDDTTVPVVRNFMVSESRLGVLINPYGHGPANAIRFGLEQAKMPVAVVTMADGSDDPTQIDDLARLVERGVVIAAASRYSAGGQQIGGPLLKSMLSRAAGVSLHLLARVGTRDATNSYKAYSTEFVREVGIDSRSGFEIGIELTAKARRLRLPVAEVPTIWIDRAFGASHFQFAAWIPRYLHWYLFAFGPRVTQERLAMLSRQRLRQGDETRADRTQGS